jgi:hypothetical protein
MPIKKHFAAHVLMFNCDQFILKMIENCAPFVEKIYVAYSDLAWTYNPRAREKNRNLTSKDIIKQSKYFNKIELIEGTWELDEDERNACLKKAKADGFDYLIIQDADEFYSKKDYKNNIDNIINNSNYDLYTTPWCSFWKNLDYVMESNEGSIIVGYPEFAINCNSSVKFVRSRTTNANTIYQLPGLCYHLSYVLTDDEVYRKINTWGHAHEFDTKSWYRRKWLKWNESMTDLHPLYHTMWKKAVRFKGKLPEELIGFKAPEIVIYKTTFIDKLEIFITELFISVKKSLLFLYKKFNRIIQIVR